MRCLRQDPSGSPPRAGAGGRAPAPGHYLRSTRKEWMNALSRFTL